MRPPWVRGRFGRWWIVLSGLLLGFSARAQGPPSVVEVHPEDGATVIGRRPTVRVVLPPDSPPPSPERLILLVDGVDVTAQVRIDENTLWYRPASDLEPGFHQVILVITDPDGRSRASLEWSFRNRDFSFLEVGTLLVGMSGVFRVQARKRRADEPDYEGQGNIQLSSHFREGALEATIEGNVYVSEQAGPGTGGPTSRSVDLGSWRFMTRLGPAQVQGGDIQIAESTLLTGQGFARRGVLGRLTLGGTELHLFRLHTQPILGFQNMLGLADPEQRLRGVSLSQTVLPHDALKLRVVFLEGQEPDVTAYSVASLEGGKRGSAYALVAMSRLLGGRLEGEAEVAFSQFDADIADDLPEVRDRAWRVGVRTQVWRTSLRGEYRRLGRNFGSVANPSLIPDREKMLLDFNANPFRFMTIAFGLQRRRDNVDRDPERPQINENLLTGTLTLMPVSRATLSLMYQRSEQTSDREPAGFPSIRITTETYSGTFSFSRAKWNASLAASYVSQTSPNGLVPGTATLSVLATLGWNPSRVFALTPSFSFTRVTDRVTGRATDTFLATLTPHVALIPDVFVFDAQVSWTRTRPLDGTPSTWNLNGTARLAWHFDRFLLQHGRQTLSVQVGYQRISGLLAPLSGEDIWSVEVRLEADVPVRLLP